jgi:hypothetical protein
LENYICLLLRLNSKGDIFTWRKKKH